MKEFEIDINSGIVELPEPDRYDKPFRVIESNICLVSNEWKLVPINIGRTEIITSKDNRISILVTGIQDVTKFNEIGLGKTLNYRFKKSSPNLKFNVVNNSSDILDINYTEESTSYINLEIEGKEIGSGSFKITYEFNGKKITLNVLLDCKTYFSPVKDLNDLLLRKLNILSTTSEMISYANDKKVRLILANNDLPNLYYRKIDSNPSIFNYEIGITDSDYLEILKPSNSKKLKCCNKEESKSNDKDQLEDIKILDDSIHEVKIKDYLLTVNLDYIKSTLSNLIDIEGNLYYKFCKVNSDTTLVNYKLDILRNEELSNNLTELSSKINYIDNDQLASMSEEDIKSFETSELKYNSTDKHILVKDSEIYLSSTTIKENIGYDLLIKLFYK